LLSTLGRVRQDGEHLQPFREVCNRFQIGRAFAGPLPGPLPVPHRLLCKARFSVVVRQQFRLCLSGLWELGFEHLGNPLVIVLPRAFQQRLVGAIPNQRVFEHVSRLWGQTSLVHNLCLNQPAQFML